MIWKDKSFMLAEDGRYGPQGYELERFGPEWVFEYKIDGVRYRIIKEGKNIYFINRGMKEFSYKYPEIVEEIKKMEGSFVLDCEIAVLKNGIPAFSLTQSRDKTNNQLDIGILSNHNPATANVFDVLELNGNVLTEKPLKERKEILLNNFGKYESKAFHLCSFSNKLGAQKMYENCVNLGLEGLMAKKIDGKYEFERSKLWVKLKMWKELDVNVLGYQKSESQSRDIANIITNMGKVNFGLNRQLQSYWTKKFKDYEIGEDNINFVGNTELGVKLKPGIMAKVKYLEITNAGVFRKPSLKDLEEMA